VIAADGTPVGAVEYPTEPAAVAARLPTQNCLLHPATTLRASAFAEAGGYRLDHVEDYDLWLRIAERHELANLRERVLLYRRHDRQVSLVEVDEQARRALVVQVAARRRRADGTDPLEGVRTPSSELLFALGIPAADVARAVAEARLTWATQLAEAGDAAVAERLLGDGPRARRTLRSALRLKAARAAAREGRRAAAAVDVARAVAASPAFVVGRIARRRPFG
jgi:hypothetical protein